MLLKKIKKVESFFHNYSKDFDEIYDTLDNKSIFKIFSNEVLRKSMKTRYLLSLSEIKKLKKKCNILDIGCGPGRYAYDLVKKKHSVVGIDFASDMIKIARKKNINLKDKTKFIIGDYLKYNFKKRYDVALLMGFFDYIEDPKKIFKKLKKDTKIFYGSFPKLFHILSPQRLLRYKLRNCPLYLYTKSSIVKDLKKSGIKKYKIIDNSREYFVIGYFVK